VAVRDRWCHHVPPATATVPCGGEVHRISWVRGKLKIEDHDLAAERTMLAFGGEKPACLQALQLWRNLHSWAMSGQLLQQMQSRLGPGGLLVPGDLQRVHELGLLLTWDRAWRHSRYFSDHGRLLRELLEQRAVPAVEAHLRRWMPEFGCRRLSGIELKVLRAGQSEGLHGQMDSIGARVTAILGARWLTRVAARGLEHVDGAFVLEVTRKEIAGDHGAVAVRAVRWERQPAGWAAPVGAPAVARPTPDGGGWSLEWDGGP
jgi:hypothetical protein